MPTPTATRADADPLAQAGRAHLRRLVLLRGLAAAGQAAALAVAGLYFRMALPYGEAAALVGGLLAFNAWSWLRLRRPVPVSNPFLFLQLVFDVAQLSALLYLTGGAANPFTGLYLLPLAISATILPGRYTWGLAGLAVACYSLLLFMYRPLPDLQGAGGDMGLHVAGMWVGFVLSAVLVAYFVVGMGRAVRERERALAEARARVQRDAQLVRLGAQAAAAAHELGTPLSTIALLADELADNPALSGEADRRRIDQLKAQVARCKAALATVSAAAGNPAASAGQVLGAGEFVAQWLAGWRSRHPEAALVAEAAAEDTGRLLADRSLYQALDNILDNAQRASPGEVRVSAGCGGEALVIEVSDRGGGLSREARQRVGREPFGPRARGMGLGLFLSHAIIERFGGEVDFYDNDRGGATARIRLPLG